MKKSHALLWLCVLAISITGVALHFMAPASDDEFPHPLSGLFRELHGVSMALGLVIFGYMLSDHVQKKIAKRKHHWDGYLHLGLWILLIASGLLLYYPQDSLEALGLNMPLWHWYVGVGLLLLFPAHVWRKALKRRYYHWRYARQIQQCPPHGRDPNKAHINLHSK